MGAVRHRSVLKQNNESLSESFSLQQFTPIALTDTPAL